MSYHNGPRIVTNGLVLYLDAGSTKSYPGSGTVWTDLSGNNNNGTLINGPTYNSDNKGSIVFDGINDYIGVTPNSTLQMADEVTLFAVVKATGFGANRIRLFDTSGPTSNDINKASFFLKVGTISPFQDISFFIVSGTSSLEVRRSTQVIVSTSIPYIIVARWRKSDGLANIYVNGVEASYANTSTQTGNMNILQNELRIGHLQSPSIFGNQIIYSVSIYNKFLSNSEIIQNYNALKGRYNL